MLVEGSAVWALEWQCLALSRLADTGAHLACVAVTIDSRSRRSSTCQGNQPPSTTAPTADRLNWTSSKGISPGGAIKVTFL